MDDCGPALAPSATTLRATIVPLRRAHYAVDFAGERIVDAVMSPEPEACVALKSRGITGTLTFRHAGAEYDASSADIETLAATWEARRTERELSRQRSRK